MGNKTSSVFHISSSIIHPEILESIISGGNLIIVPDTYSPRLCTIKPSYILSISDSSTGKLYYRKVRHITFSNSLEGPIKLYGVKKFNPNILTNKEAINKLERMYPQECNRYIVMILDFYS